jgi:hypothetical protein
MNSLVQSIILISSALTAVVAIAALTKKGRDWLIKPAVVLGKENQLSILRVEILLNIHNAPEKIEVIEDLYDEYTKLGGNKYISSVIHTWRDKYANDVIRGRI